MTGCHIGAEIGDSGDCTSGTMFFDPNDCPAGYQDLPAAYMEGPWLWPLCEAGAYLRMKTFKRSVHRQ
jgi:hypothetical protein